MDARSREHDVLKTTILKTVILAKAGIHNRFRSRTIK
jgi:hypothetical protein